MNGKIVYLQKWGVKKLNKQKKITLIVIIIAVLLMGIGYAVISNITLTVNGKASATVDSENFKVYYTGVSSKKTEENAEVTVTSGSTTATVNFTGLTTKDDEEYVILEIENGSNGIDASSINVTASGQDNTVIKVDTTMCTQDGTAITDYAVASQAKTYVKVAAKLLQTPTSDVETTITATITAVAKEAN